MICAFVGRRLVSDERSEHCAATTVPRSLLVRWQNAVSSRSKTQSTPATMSKQRSTLLPKRQQCWNSFFRDYSCSICFDYVERILRLVAFDNVASILLLVWTELYTKQRLLSARRPRRMHTCDSVLPLFASRCGVCCCVPCTMYYQAQHWWVDASCLMYRQRGVISRNVSHDVNALKPFPTTKCK